MLQLSKVTWSLLGTGNAGKARTWADVGTAAAMWMTACPPAGCSKQPVRHLQPAVQSWNVWHCWSRNICRSDATQCHSNEDQM